MEKLANSHQTGSIWESKETLPSGPMPTEQSCSFRRVDSRFSAATAFATRTGPDGRCGLATVNHFMNRVRTQPGRFSCAINCFLELWHYIVRHVFTEISGNELFFLANQMSAYYNFFLKLHVIQYIAKIQSYTSL